MVPDSFQQAKELIKSRIDIVALVADVVQLKRSGRSYRGLCPFHGEKTPSFHVFPDSQHYKCFGCGVGGDIFSFLMERERLDFKEAFAILAERCGVPMPRATAQDHKAKQKQESSFEFLQQVQAFFVEMLRGKGAAAAHAYIEERKFEKGIIAFELGYAPGAIQVPGGFGGSAGGSMPARRWALHGYLKSKGLPLESAVELGLLGQTRKGEYYDRFRERLIFPIHDERGRIVGFGGRILPGFESDKEPKYLNSPESPIFNKRKLLFGLHRARKALCKSLVVMEGYTDVMAAHLAGLESAVATLGTSLTQEHASLLRRFAVQGVSLLFDGDSAGLRAAERAYPALATELLSARICLMPEGLDPADLLSQDGRSGLDQVLAQGRDALDVYLSLLGGRLDLASHEGKMAAASSCREVLHGVADPLRRSDLLERMAAALFLPAQLLGAGLDSRSRRRREESPEAAPKERDSAAQKMERVENELLAAILRDPTLLTVLEELWPGEAETLGSPLARKLVRHVRDWVLSKGDFPESSGLLRSWMTLAAGDSSASTRVLRVEGLSRALKEPKLALLDGVRFLRKRLQVRDFHRKREALRKSLRLGDDGQRRALEFEFKEAWRKLHETGQSVDELAHDERA